MAKDDSRPMNVFTGKPIESPDAFRVLEERENAGKIKKMEVLKVIKSVRTQIDHHLRLMADLLEETALDPSVESEKVKEWKQLQKNIETIRKHLQTEVMPALQKGMAGPFRSDDVEAELVVLMQRADAFIARDFASELREAVALNNAHDQGKGSLLDSPATKFELNQAIQTYNQMVSFYKERLGTEGFQESEEIFRENIQKSLGELKRRFADLKDASSQARIAEVTAKMEDFIKAIDGVQGKRKMDEQALLAKMKGVIDTVEESHGGGLQIIEAIFNFFASCMEAFAQAMQHLSDGTEKFFGTEKEALQESAQLDEDDDEEILLKPQVKEKTQKADEQQSDASSTPSQSGMFSRLSKIFQRNKESAEQSEPDEKPKAKK